MVSGGVIDIAGLLFGNADDIAWQHSNGSGGKAYGAPFFQTGKVELTPGDNLITVTATKGDQTASDTILVTYNPVFQFADRLKVDPRVVKVGQSATLRAVVNLGKTTNFVAGSLKVFRTDDNGNQLKNFGPMVDDGALTTSGDEIKGDGLYSKQFELTATTTGTIKIRASLLFKVGAKQYAAFTDIVEVDAVENIPESECVDIQGALSAAKTAALNAGGGAAGQQAAIDSLKASGIASIVDKAQNGSDGVWVQFTNGTLGVINLNAKGTRGGNEPRYDSVDQLPGANLALATVKVQSKRALLLDPYRDEFGDNEIGSSAQTIKETACPAYELDSGDALGGDKGTMNYYRQLYEYGVIATATHGDTVFGQMSADLRKNYGFSSTGSQEIFWTGHKSNCGYFKSGPPASCSEKQGCGPESQCVINQTGGKGVCVDHLTADLRRGRVVFGADGVYGLTPTFIRRHAERSYPRSLIYIGACRSLYNGSIASEFIAAGAATVVGYDGNISNNFAIKWGTTFIKNVIGQKQLSGVAHVQIEDSENPGSRFRLVGAQNLDAFYSDLLNPSWEAGNVSGWIKSGDGRVVPKLGATVPVGGKFMGILSTGLGYTTQTGELRQRFCVQAGRKKLKLWWKFYSEEFKEYCGSEYQDAFRVELVATSGKKTVVNVKVDDLCDKGGSCSNCGSQFKGLTKADVSFDQGDVYMTPWVQSEVDVAPFAGNGNVNLRLFTTDVGDSIYDTAILVDKIDVQ